MLEQLRRQSGSFVIWLIFAIIIAAFVLFFGPQSSGDLGCGASNDFIVEVDGQPLGIHSWRYAMNSQRSGLPATQRQTRAIDALIGRAILANAAARSGLEVSKDQVIENLKEGLIYILGVRLPPEAIFDNGVFDYEKLKYLARQRGLPGIDYLIDEQRQEILADITRKLILSGRTSREENEHRFIVQNTTAKATYVKYDTATYAKELSLSDADYDRYLASHEKEIADLFEARKAIYKDVKPQLKLRHIMLAKAAKASSNDDSPDPNADGAAEDATAADKRKQADSLRAELIGGADFAEVARRSSEDTKSAKKGGLLGWRPAESIGFGDELNRAVADLAEGSISEVIETPDAFHIVRIEGKRSGELSYDDVKYELAESKATSFYAKKLAKRDAEAALAQLKSGKPFEELFTPADPASGPKTGALTTATTTLASWGPGLAIGEQVAVPPESDEDSSGDTPTAAAPAADDTLPTVEVPAPALSTMGPVSRRGGDLPGLGMVPDVAEALFDTLEIGAVADQVFEIPTGFVIIRLDAREQANLDEFDNTQVHPGDDPEACLFPLQMVAVTRSSATLPPTCSTIKKSIDNLQEFLFEECSKIAEEGRLRVNTAFLEQQADNFKYRPCGTLDFESALVQVLSMSSAF